MSINDVAVADVEANTAVMDSGENAASKPKRRTFSAEYKLAILDAYDRLDEQGAKGALLRREGLYGSQILEWRKARDAGALNGLARQGRKPAVSKDELEAQKWKARALRAEGKLEKTEAALEALGKLHALLEIISESADTKTK